jgi:DNA processing protein
MDPAEIVTWLPPGHGHLAGYVLESKGRRLDHAARLLDRLAERGGRALIIGEPEYPSALPSYLGAGAPPLIFLAGSADWLGAPSAAVVGARVVSKAGARLAWQCGAAFAGEDIPVVSGGAAGADSAAHAAALAEGGKTVVVLPQGLFTYVCPPEICEGLEEGRALLLSEFPPDAPWRRHAAVTRNATISALARLVCVIEPKKTGGSIRNGRCALVQGKRVLVHGTGPSAPGVKALIQAGALELMDDNGRFRAGRLRELWHSAPEPPPRQMRLGLD